MGELLDRALIYRVQKCVDGSNCHQLGNWLFAYQCSEPNTPSRTQCEYYLRAFVYTWNLRQSAWHGSHRADRCV
jgi:hypothetical protein